MPDLRAKNFSLRRLLYIAAPPCADSSMPSARTSTSGRAPEHPASSFRFHPFSPSNTTEARRAGNFAHTDSAHPSSPVFRQAGRKRTARPRVFPFPNRPLPAYNENFSTLHPPKTFRKPAHIFSDRTLARKTEGEPQPSFIVNFPAPSVPDAVPPLHTEETSRQPSAFFFDEYIDTAKQRTIRSSAVIPPRLRLPRKKSRIPATQNFFDRKSSRPGMPLLFRHRSNPRPARPTVRMSNEDRDGQNGPLPASSSRDGRTNPGRQTPARTFRLSVKTDRRTSIHKTFYLAPPACHGSLPCTLPCRGTPGGGRSRCPPLRV